jgi:hypothetical protein
LQELSSDFDQIVLGSFTRGAPVRLRHGQWRRPGLPTEDLEPCIAVPVCGSAGEGIAIALYGPHDTGSDINADECETLHELADHAGLGYDRAETEQLRREVQRLRGQIEMAAPETGRVPQ